MTKTLLFILISNLIFAQNISKPKDTLPVELVYFVGDVVDSKVELRWGTATEVNNYGYDIKRADTSFNWESIGFVQGHGNSNSPKDYIFVDSLITVNGAYYYLLKQIDTDGNFELTHDTVKVIVDYITSIKENILSEKFQPEEFELFQNYPNPFNPTTNISFNVLKRSFVTLKLFSIRGEELKTIFSGIVTAGTHSVKFASSDLSSGTYIYKLSVGNISVSKKMLLIK